MVFCRGNFTEKSPEKNGFRPFLYKFFVPLRVGLKKNLNASRPSEHPTQEGKTYLKKNQNGPRPSEHPPVKGEKHVKTFRWYNARRGFHNAAGGNGAHTE